MEFLGIVDKVEIKRDRYGKVYGEKYLISIFHQNKKVKIGKFEFFSEKSQLKAGDEVIISIKGKEVNM